MKLILNKLSDEEARRVNELYDWLSQQGLTTKEAMELLRVTHNGIAEAKNREADSMLL